MDSWERLFATAANSGVYPRDGASAADIQKIARKSRLAFFHLNGKAVAGKRDFLRVAANAFRFPEYFGENWDAFEDCLTDLPQDKGSGYVLLVDGLHDFASASPAEFETARAIFRDAAEFWKDRGIRFFVVLGERKSPR
jgi:hypothetical protein